MNKIFKVVWNKARGCYMAVCEYAKSQTKSCSTAKLFANKRAVALGMAAVLTMGFVGDASAEDVLNVKVINPGFDFASDVPANGNMIVGAKSSSMPKANAEIGLFNYIFGGSDNVIDSTNPQGQLNTIVNGTNNEINQNFSTIIGSDFVTMNKAKGEDPGYRKAWHSVAVGVCHGEAEDTYGTLIGGKNIATGGRNATVIGSFGSSTFNENKYENFTVKANGEFSTIIGASGAKLVTISADEIDHIENNDRGEENRVVVLKDGTKIYSEDEVRYGRDDYGEKVTSVYTCEVAEGEVYANGNYSTIMGAESEKGKKVETIGDYSTIIGVHANEKDVIAGTNSVIIGGVDSSAKGSNSVVLAGNDSHADVNDALAFGANTSVTEIGGVALGANSVADRKAGLPGANPLNADTTKNPNAWTSTAAAVAVGDGNTVTRQITGVAAGKEDTDAVNVAQLNAVIEGAGKTYDFAFDGAVGVGGGLGAVDISENGTNKWQIIAGKGVTITEGKNNQFVIATNGGSVDPIEPGDVKMGFEGDVGDVGDGKRPEVAGGQYLTIQGGATEYVDHPNIAVVGDKKNGALNLRLAKDVNLKDGSLTLSKGGKTVIIEGDNVDMGGNQIHNVEAGKDKKDAVNVEQMEKYVAEHGGGDITEINNKINKISNNVNKVGARAAALAALHPMDFDPDDKLNFAVGYGHYKGENAGAIGAFYRPDEKVMFSVGGTVAEHDTMINAGISFSLDRTARQTNTKTAMARDIIDLKAENAEMKAQIQQLINQNNMFLNAINQITGNQGKPLDTSKIVMFPDVPSTHWAYEYIEGLQKLGIIEGYPNGNFSGDRSCTRYEFAAMLFRALKAGQVIPEALANEFKAELGRFRVDRIAGEDNDAKKIERIRVNGGDDRDHYGTKMVAAK